VEPRARVIVGENVVNINSIIGAGIGRDQDLNSTRRRFRARAIPGRGDAPVGEDVVTTSVRVSTNERQISRINNIPRIVGIRSVTVLSRCQRSAKLRVGPVIPFVFDPKVIGSRIKHAVRDITNVPALEVPSIVVQINDVTVGVSGVVGRVPVIAIGVRVSRGVGGANGNSSVVADPIINLGVSMTTGVVGDRGEPVVPGVLIIFSPFVRVISSKLATVFVVVILIEASGGIANKVLPRVLRLVGGVKAER